MLLSTVTAIMKCILSFMLLTCTIINCGFSDLIADSCETEIDQRPPRSFKSNELLSVRLDGFKYLSHRDDPGDIIFIPNWEIFANNYWYETRHQNMSCPMTPTGIAAACDWALLVPCLFGDLTKPPKTVFVHTLMLPHFAESLGFLNGSYRFALISGGCDQTVPNGSGDIRYKKLRGIPQGGENYNRLMNSDSVVHWFAENRDAYHPKLSSLPTGLVGEDVDDMEDFKGITYVPLSERPLHVLSADRLRNGGQWRDRWKAQEMCANISFCIRPMPHVAGENMNRSSYLSLVGSIPFVACVHGGGLDPSPKAWETIMAGSIPIVQRNQVSDAYDHLPVAYVNDWSELLGNEEKGKVMLQKWLAELSPFYVENSDLRKRTLHRLKTAYWLEVIDKKVRESSEEEDHSHNHGEKTKHHHPTSRN